MQFKNTRERFGAIAGACHWLIASAFILSYPFVYYVVYVLERDRSNPLFLPVLNVHWFLGIVVGVLVIPRLLWRWMNIEPEESPGSKVEHLLARLAHWGLYALMIIMPATGYLGTGGKTSATIDFYLFEIPRFPNTELFRLLQIDWATFEPIMDGIHHFSGQWLAPTVVLLHIAAAFYHHYVRGDTVLLRMLPEGAGAWLRK
ncbi:MAG: cytochrome b [Moraxellaceae bacterium]|nr:cytochrome b [Moraxellaceae bacterium]